MSFFLWYHYSKFHSNRNIYQDSFMWVILYEYLSLTYRSESIGNSITGCSYENGELINVQRTYAWTNVTNFIPEWWLTSSYIESPIRKHSITVMFVENEKMEYLSFSLFDSQLTEKFCTRCGYTTNELLFPTRKGYIFPNKVNS